MAQRDIGNLRTRLSWEDEGSTRSLTRFKEDLKGLRSEMRTITSQGKDYANSLKGLKQQSDVLTRQYKTQQDRVKELNKRYQESIRVKGEDDKQTRNLAAQYNNAVAEMNRMEGQLERVNAAIREQENPWNVMSKQLTNTGEKMQEVGRSMTEFGKSYSMRVTAPIVAGGVAMFKASMDYESAFAGVMKTVDDSEEGYAKLSAGIREMAKELPTSASEIASVAEAAGQLGIENDSILSFTRTIIDLGESTNLSLDQASSEFARFANIVGMSQDDFDRLGSSVVGLGNTMATTESEIVALGMRLAAQGAQVGMSEAQIMALSATMSSLGLSAEAGGTAMTTVLKKIDGAVGESGKELAAFAKVAGVSSSEFAKVWEKDAISALDLFIKGLAESGESGENLTAILEDLGIKGIREADTMLRLAGASDLLAGAVDTSSKAWEENTALTDEAAQRYETTESQLKIMWNRIKDVSITMGNALVPAVMDAIDAAEPLIEQIESGAKAFSEMDEEQQQTILKMIALVAAVGPASVALGGLTTTIGGVLKVGGSLTGMLGKASAGGKGGAGLLGGIGMLAPLATSPVGLAIAGVGALGGIIYAATKYTKDLHDVNYELIDSVDEEVNAIKNLEDRFTELYSKNKLTADEMLRYMDIMSELEKAEGEEAIKKLTAEQEALLEKSGFTNAEMEEFIGLNNTIVETTPNVTSAISEQGNAFVDNLDVLKELNAEKLEGLMMDAQRELEKALDNENQLLKDQKDLESEIKDIRKEINETQSTRLSTMDELEQAEARQEEINNQIATLKEEMKGMDVDALLDANTKLSTLEQQRDEQREYVEELELEKGKQDTIYDRLLKKIKEKNKELDLTRDELAEIDKMIGDYETLILKQAGINSEKGKGLDAIDKELAKIEEAQKELDKKNQKTRGGVKDYEEQNKKLSTQKQRLLDAQKELEEINRLAGQTVYDKELHIKTVPTIGAINRDIAASVTKRVNIQADNRPQRLAYKTGTDYHLGGQFLAGEEGFELGRLGNRWEMLNFGTYTRPEGYQVFTHDESKRILNAMNRMPAYANGTNMGAETNRIVNQLNNTESVGGQPVVIEVHVTSEMDSKAVGKGVARVVTDLQNRSNFRRRRMPNA